MQRLSLGSGSHLGQGDETIISQPLTHQTFPRCTPRFEAKLTLDAHSDPIFLPFFLRSNREPDLPSLKNVHTPAPRRVVKKKQTKNPFPVSRKRIINQIDHKRRGIDSEVFPLGE